MSSISSCEVRLGPLRVWGWAILIVFLGTVSIAHSEPPSESTGKTAQELDDEEWVRSFENKAVQDGSDTDDEDPDEDLEEEEEDVFAGAEVIQVNANRRTENLQKAAMSVTAFGSGFLEEVGLTDFSDLQNFTPNLQIISQGDSRSTSIRIRGIGSVGTNAGIDPSVGVFIDGVYQGRAGMSVVDLLDIQSVEVLRGPQGTLYGKNTAAGAIKIESKKPTYDLGAQLEFVTGDFDLFEMRFTANVPIVDDKIAARLTGYRVTRDGYETNQAPSSDGDHINDTTRWGLRASTLIDVTNDLEILIRGDYAEVDEDCCTPNVWQYGNDPTAFPPSLEVLAEDAGVTLVPTREGSRNVSVDLVPKNQIKVGGASVEVKSEWLEHSLTWLTAYRTYSSDSGLDADFSELDVLSLATDVEFDQGSMEFRVASPDYKLLDYVAGLYLFYSDLDTGDALTFRDEAVAFFVGQKNTGTNQHRTTSVAGFADANFKISELWGDTPNITITGGVRVGWERKDHAGTQISRGPLGTLETAISGPDSFSNQHSADTYVTGRAIVKWEPVVDLDFVGDTMLYAGVSTGYKSAGYNQLRTTGGADDESVLFFRPEKSKSYEVGTRTTWLDRMITFNITGFFTDYEDFQTQVFDGLGITVLNAGSFETYGFEADLTLVPIEGWMTIFGVGYTKTKYTDFDRGPCAQGPGRACSPDGFQDLKGKRLDNTPTWNLTLFSTYERALPHVFLRGTDLDVNWFVSMEYSYQSFRYLNTSLDSFLRVDPTNTVGLRAGIREPDGQWEANIWVRNVTDEDVYGIGLDVPTVGGYAAFLLPPRTIGGTIRVKF